MRSLAAIITMAWFLPISAAADPLYDRMVDGVLDYFIDVCLTNSSHGEAFDRIMKDFGKPARWEDLDGDGGHELLEVSSPTVPLSALISNDTTDESAKLCAVAFPAESRDAIYRIVADKLKAEVGFLGDLTATDRGPAFVISEKQQVYLDELAKTNESGQRVIVIARMKGE